MFEENKHGYNLRDIYNEEFKGSNAITYEKFEQLVVEYMNHMGQDTDEYAAAKIIAIKYKTPAFVRTNFLQLGKYIDKAVAIKGLISFIGDSKVYNTKSGASGNYTFCTLIGPTGQVKVCFWDDAVALLQDVTLNDTVEIRGYVKKIPGTGGLRIDCKQLQISTEKMQMPFLTLDEINDNTDVNACLRVVDTNKTTYRNGTLTLYTYLVEDSVGLSTITSWQALDVEVNKVYDFLNLRGAIKDGLIVLKANNKTKIKQSNNKITNKKSTYYHTILENLTIGLIYNYTLTVSEIKDFTYVKQGVEKIATRITLTDQEDVNIVLVDWSDKYKITNDYINRSLNLNSFYITRNKANANKLNLHPSLFSSINERS